MADGVHLAKVVFSRYKICMAQSRTSELLNRLAKIVVADGFAHGLQPVQWQALQYLERANRFSRTPTGLTAWLGQTKGSVSQTIMALEAKGLVRRQDDPQDRRVVRLELTQAGRDLLSAPPEPVASQMLGRLAPSEQAMLAELLEQMLRSQLAANAQRPFGECRACRHHVGAQSGQHNCALLDVPLDEEDAASICIEQEAA